MFDYARLRTDLLALAVLAMAVFLGLSLASYDPADPPALSVFPARAVAQNLGGSAGAIAAHLLVVALGVGAYFLLVALIVADIRLFARDKAGDPVWRLVGATLMLVAVCVAAQWFLPFSLTGPLTGNGGYIGAWAGILLDDSLTRLGSVLLLSSMFVAGLLLTGEHHLVKTAICTSLLPITLWSRLAFGRRPAKVTDPLVPEVEELPVEEPAFVPVVPVSNLSKLALVPSPDWYSSIVDIPAAIVSSPLPTPAQDEVLPVPVIAPLALVSPEATDHGMTFSIAAHRAPIKVNPPVGMRSIVSATPKTIAPPTEKRTYQLPDDSLLEEAEAFPYDVLAAKAQIAAATLERAFQDFNLNIKVVEIDTGPVITQFELELEKGLRLSKVTALADDLAIALRVPSVRVVAPIPGKNTVGVEVPNDVRVMVRLKELLQTCQSDFDSKGIPLFLGKDVSGKPMVIDMCKMPHLLIAGRTGTGKSVCLNTLILSILLSRSPDQVKMLMIDPKMVELSPYSRIPHLMHPVITDMKKAEAVLGWAVDKMEERYDLLARCGVRHLDSYNKLGKDKVLRKLDIDPDSEEADLVPETMPYIVIIADEMADMMMTSGKDVEGHIIRLAQKSRAVGIHLVLATQKPTVDVITGLIKSNLPARISFQVASRMDSRVVLDEMGADKLLGNGDLLYMAPGTSTLRRAQGTFVSDDEVNRVIEFFGDQQPEYDPELMNLNVASSSSKGGKGSSEPRDRDDLYEQAVEIVIREGRGSVSLLQRALGVGYGRGARMIDWMAEDGIVGTFNGSQAREVVMTMDEWEDAREMASARG
jgi:DNA segregation ATPase FtsK/SpoIIIE, S-DNA-T family